MSKDAVPMGQSKLKLQPSYLAYLGYFSNISRIYLEYNPVALLSPGRRIEKKKKIKKKTVVETEITESD